MGDTLEPRPAATDARRARITVGSGPVALSTPSDRDGEDPDFGREYRRIRTFWRRCSPGTYATGFGKWPG